MKLKARLGNRSSESDAVCSRLSRNLGSDTGTSVLEMALLTPLLLMLLGGIIEVGRYAQLSILVTNAARAGVQYGAQSLVTAADTAGIQSAAVNDAPNALNNSAPVCVSSWGCYYPQFNGPINVRTTCPSMPVESCPANSSAVYVQVNTHAIFTPLFSVPGLPVLAPVNGMAQMRVAQ
jgi:Flp pilus assembly protein TadG